ncbi:hypothetical protein AAHC03_026860 [Spirometra sp. Aus1]
MFVKPPHAENSVGQFSIDDLHKLLRPFTEVASDLEVNQFTPYCGWTVRADDLSNKDISNLAKKTLRKKSTPGYKSPRSFNFGHSKSLTKDYVFKVMEDVDNYIKDYTLQCSSVCEASSLKPFKPTSRTVSADMETLCRRAHCQKLSLAKIPPALCCLSTVCLPSIPKQRLPCQGLTSKALLNDTTKPSASNKASRELSNDPVKQGHLYVNRTCVKDSIRLNAVPLTVASRAILKLRADKILDGRHPRFREVLLRELKSLKALRNSGDEFKEEEEK